MKGLILLGGAALFSGDITAVGDTEWLEKRAETERNGPLVETVETMFLAPTAYSKVK